MPTLTDYLIFSALLFTIGSAGLFSRRNLLVMLLSLEIMIGAVTVNFAAFARHRVTGGETGQGLALFTLAIAAAEIAVALALALNLYRHYRSVSVDKIRSLKG